MVQVEPGHHQTGLHRMQMGIDEGGREQPAVEVDLRCAGPVVAGAGVIPDVADRVPADHHGGRAGFAGRVDPPTEQDHLAAG